MEHVEYPHVSGYLIDCPACEARCHCRPGYAECVFEGEHNGFAHGDLRDLRKDPLSEAQRSVARHYGVTRIYVENRAEPITEPKLPTVAQYAQQKQMESYRAALEGMFMPPTPSEILRANQADAARLGRTLESLTDEELRERGWQIVGSTEPSCMSCDHGESLHKTTWPSGCQADVGSQLDCQCLGFKR